MRGPFPIQLHSTPTGKIYPSSKIIVPFEPIMGFEFPRLPLRSRGAFRASNHKIDYVPQVKEILHLKGNPNCIIASRVTVILLEGWILVVGELHRKGSAPTACAASLLFNFSENLPRNPVISYCNRIRTRQEIYGQIYPFGWRSSCGQSPREFL